MPEGETVPLDYAKPKAGDSICRWLSDPETLLAKLVTHLFVQSERVNQTQFIVKQATQPGPDDQGKIWIKTSSPYGIGFFAGGEWRISPTIPSGLIYIIKAGEDVPLGYRELTDQERQQVGLASLSGGRYIISS